MVLCGNEGKYNIRYEGEMKMVKKTKKEMKKKMMK